MMPSDISPTTGQGFYSGSWQDVRRLCQTLGIGDARIDKVTGETVNFYQEIVDREIDASLEQYYFVPLRRFNQVQPDGETRSVFPGNIRALALYWTAGRLMSSEFQQLESNLTEATTAYLDVSRRQLFDIIRYNRRIPGQALKHNLPTMPPTLAPAVNPEPNF